jgi:hypothetical protein
MTLVTADASTPTIGTQALIDKATASGPVARYVKSIAQAAFWDELQAAVWMKPEVARKKGRLAMDIDLMPGPITARC